MYKPDSAKYGGTIDENFQEAFDRYLRAIEDLQLPTTKGLKLLHNMLTGEALSFFSSISATCQTLSDARENLTPSIFAPSSLALPIPWRHWK